ncbi:c-type cytochrome [Maritimibacter sp. UBA3975]|uniref:c-type cytochrome n=1 Tax=Maritimibacter sp. UBA3975 TaxID=1946833 RepID=UPI000C0A95D0|nr:c-type cytochrome [Maritimibacter sp. UBA3975]MAM62988.1 cytochrome C [Maritimibacter sp.]|tara:strand:+ start:12792 stop:13604 length:813 start_codon:yes stop_codon:yes gene_type:complete
MKLARTAILAIASVSLGSAAIVQAQDQTEEPEMSELERRLDVDSVLFNATIKEEPDDDLLELGRLVAMGSSENGGSGMACITCHGVDGEGDGSGAFPRLDGQAGWYMYKQLQDYASGDRPNRVMSGIAQRLTEREREAVSAYYAAMPSGDLDTAHGSMDGTLLQWGGQLAAVGSAEKGIPACVNCHGAQGTGLPPSVPYLAGQYAGYMELQLELWTDGTRDNDAMDVMSTIAKKMTEEDMRAVSEYYARVSNPATDGAEAQAEYDMPAAE